jgi:hypothetical protein
MHGWHLVLVPGQWPLPCPLFVIYIHFLEIEFDVKGNLSFFLSLSNLSPYADSQGRTPFPSCCIFLSAKVIIRRASRLGNQHILMSGNGKGKE